MFQIHMYIKTLNCTIMVKNKNRTPRIIEITKIWAVIFIRHKIFSNIFIRFLITEQDLYYSVLEDRV